MIVMQTQLEQLLQRLGLGWTDADGAAACVLTHQRRWGVLVAWDG